MMSFERVIEDCVWVRACLPMGGAPAPAQNSLGQGRPPGNWRDAPCLFMPPHGPCLTPILLQLQLQHQKDAADLVAPYSRSFQRVPIRSILQSEGEGVKLAGNTLRVGGWVKTGREAGAGAGAFLAGNDGSGFANRRGRGDKEVAAAGGGLGALTPTSTCVLIEGVLAETPPGTKQKVCY